MYIPNTIKVGHIIYSVHFENYTNENGNRGETFLQSGKICIDPSMSFEQQWTTLIHELLHCCCDFAGINSDEKNKMTEEQFVSHISAPLAQILIDNNLSGKPEQKTIID